MSAVKRNSVCESLGKAIFARLQPHGELGWRAAGRRTHAQPEWPERTVPRSRVASRQADLRISAATATLRELPRSARRPQRAWESDSKRAAERATGERTLRRRAHPPRVRPPSMCRARSRPPGDSPSVEATWRQPSVPSPDIPGHKQAARNRLGDVGAAGEDGGGDTLRHALPAGCDAGLESTECRGAAPGGPRIEFGARLAESAVPLDERPEVPRSEQGRCKVVEEAEAGEHDGIGAVIPRQQENPHSRGIGSTASSRPSLLIIPHVRPLSSFGSVTAPSTPVRMKPAMIPIPPAQSAASFLFPGNEESRRHSASAERGLDPFGDAAQGGSVIRLVREHASGPFPSGGVGRRAGGIFPPDGLRADTRPRRRFEANPGHQAIAGIPRFQPVARWPPASFRGSRAVHRDNPVFKFAPEFPEVPRRADGVLEGFDEIVHFVRTGVTRTLCGSLEAAGSPRDRGEPACQSNLPQGFHFRTVSLVTDRGTHTRHPASVSSDVPLQRLPESSSIASVSPSQSATRVGAVRGSRQSAKANVARADRSQHCEVHLEAADQPSRQPGPPNPAVHAAAQPPRHLPRDESQAPAPP